MAKKKCKTKAKAGEGREIKTVPIDRLFSPLPDLNPDDPHFLSAVVEALRGWRRNFIPDLGANAERLRYYTEAALEIYAAFPGTYGYDTQLREVPLAQNPDRPTEQDFIHLEQRLLDVAAAERAEIERESRKYRESTAEPTAPNAADAAQDKSDDGGDEKPKRKVKEPAKEAIQAYQLVVSMDMKQKDAATEMSKEHKRKIRQGQISRWVKKAREWYKANGLPVESAKSKPNIIPTDPDILNMGLRTDGKITGDPRHKRR